MRATCAVLVLALLGAGVAHADGDEELARRHFRTGQLLYERSMYADALHEFEAARAVLRRPPFDYNIGLCLEYLRRWDEAADAFARFADAGVPDADAAAAWKRVAGLRAHRPLASTAVAFRPGARVLRLLGGLSTSLGAGILLSAIPTGVLSLRARDDYRSGCMTTCDPALYDTGHRLAVTTDALVGVGVAFAVAGVTMLGVSFRRQAVAAPTPDAVRPF